MSLEALLVEPARLTPRQRDVLVGAALGETCMETGRRLHISGATVKFYRQLAYARLEARNLPHAVYLASKQGLI